MYILVGHNNKEVQHHAEITVKLKSRARALPYKVVYSKMTLLHPPQTLVQWRITAVTNQKSNAKNRLQHMNDTQTKTRMSDSRLWLCMTESVRRTVSNFQSCNQRTTARARRSIDLYSIRVPFLSAPNVLTVLGQLVFLLIVCVDEYSIQFCNKRVLLFPQTFVHPRTYPIWRNAGRVLFRRLGGEINFNPLESADENVLSKFTAQ